MDLDPRMAETLRQLYAQMEGTGKLIPASELPGYYRTFSERFGPEVLGNLDGEELLRTMYESRNHDSLVYWLEFKNDEELPARFGSIAGGNPLKFGIYRRKETGEWMSGSPQAQQRLPLEEAVANRIHRRGDGHLLCRGSVDGKPRRGRQHRYANCKPHVQTLPVHSGLATDNSIGASPGVSSRATGEFLARHLSVYAPKTYGGIRVRPPVAGVVIGVEPTLDGRSTAGNRSLRQEARERGMLN